MKEHFKRLSADSQYPMNGEAWIADKFNEINKEKKPYVLVSVNIKKFKYLNLRYGWEQGNEILYKIYLALQSQLEEGEYLAHSFGDNFVLLIHSRMWDTQEERANEFIQTIIMKFIDAIFDAEDERLHGNTYASFGIYPTYFEDCSYYEALERAELFRKEDGGIKHRTFTVNYYNKDCMYKFLDKYNMVESTAGALKRGEYQVFVQPKINLATGKIAGGEALLRRFDENGEPVPLYKFINILNEEGYIRKIDWFVFETACKKISEQSLSGKPIVPISFNISKDFFYDVFMLDNYIETYKKYNVPQEYIEFELMETISLNDTSRMIEVIGQFKRAGFKCSLDDFGNGYSSFGVLLNADLDYIKMDRIFFINPLDEANKMIIKGVVDILKFLGFKIVAEGIETKEYVDYLSELGCDLIQGYYFYKPMPIDDFMELIAEENR